MKLDRITRLNTRKKIGKLTRVSHRFKWNEHMAAFFNIEFELSKKPTDFIVTISRRKAIFTAKYDVKETRIRTRVLCPTNHDLRHLFVLQPEKLTAIAIQRVIQERIAPDNQSLEAANG